LDGIEIDIPPIPEGISMPGHFETLLETIHTLRSPGGCPWDRKQSLHNASRYLMDEAGELVDATLAGDITNAREELADLLFMTCFCCEILGETEPVTMHDIAREGNEKLIRRHPHVFGDAEASDSGESQERWNAIKREEKRARGLDPDSDSVLKEMPSATAPLHQAFIYQENASKVGFDWPDLTGVWDKLHEELDELKEAVTAKDASGIEHELGDLLFSVANLARRFKVQPDMALRSANKRFRDRFHLVEEEFRNGDRPLKDASLDELEASWQKAKRQLG
jgi:tetrapyrrole methylase family protein/MazG family protein